MRFDADRLAALLRQYADTEHGKRARLHLEISQLVFHCPADLAAIIEAQRKRQREAIYEIAAEAKRLGLE